ncbi:MAG: zinc protease [Candidatus Dojkabacteria bacterium]|nr:MAG: zinc protease [Candidatus Dojkabacteria bacterium]
MQYFIIAPKMLDRSKKPKTKNYFELQNIVPEVLCDDKVEIFYHDQTKEDVIVLKLYYPLNALDIPNALVTSYLAKVLLECGTQKYSFKELLDAYTYHGISLSMFSNPFALEINGECLTSKFSELLHFLDEIIYQPRFDVKEFKKIMLRAKQNFKINMNDNSYLADVLMGQKMFGNNNPYGYFLKEKDYDDIAIDQFKTLHEERVIPRTPTVSIAGNLSEKQLKQLQKFLTERASKKVPFDTGIKFTKPATNKKLSQKIKKKATQTSIRSFSIISNIDCETEEFFNLKITNFIYGGSFFNCRLMQTLREEKGYTYGAHSWLSDYNSHALALEISTEVKSETTQDSIKIIFDEMINLSHNKLQKNLIPMVKIKLKTKLADSLSHAFRQLDFYIERKLKNIDPQESLKNYVRAIENFNHDVLVQTAENFLRPENFYTVLVTPQKVSLD